VGRARAALVYALARSGAVADARSEVDKLESQTKSHPLLAELRSFVLRYESAADAGVAAANQVAAVDVSKLPKLDTRPGPPGESEKGGTIAVSGGDFRVKLKQANLALQRGDLETAHQLYQAVLSQQPNNTEAMSGLAEVARKRKDPETARRMNEKVLEQNPSYLPALIAAADSRWETGDRAGALKLYRRVLEQAGPGTEYGQRAQARIAQSEKSGSEKSGSSPAEPPSQPAPSPPSEDKPQIDTTDLPEHNK
jgi:tetratricopeptide (TPR) repeat protein